MQARRSAAFAPGRVNLVGEHTDYNEGLALPFAIREGVTVRAQATVPQDARLRVSALDLDQSDEFRIDDPPSIRGWRAFARGIVAELGKLGLRLPSASLQITGNVPRGAGLSSSAAMEVALCLALIELGGEEIECSREEVGRSPGQGPLDRIQIAQLCADVENRWVGAQTGLLDQLACLCSATEMAARIDFRSLEVSLVPLTLEGWRIVLLDSGQRHSHASSGYNQRRQECAQACTLLGIASLRDAEVDGLGALPERLRRRARHVITENERVEEAVEALSRGKMAALGLLLDASHASLRDDYEVSTPAVEAAIAEMRRAGAAGARLIGGGFGGMVLGLFAPGHTPPAQSREVQPGPGAHLLCDR